MATRSAARPPGPPPPAASTASPSGISPAATPRRGTGVSSHENGESGAGGNGAAMPGIVATVHQPPRGNVQAHTQRQAQMHHAQIQAQVQAQMQAHMQNTLAARGVPRPRGALDSSPVVVNDYVLTRVLGIGSHGKVKLAVHRKRGYWYACKILDKEKVRGRHLGAQVRKEILIMRQLKHPNIVRLYTAFSTKDKIYIIMELVTGGELFDEILRLKRLGEPHARFYFRQLLQGLMHCHAQGVYHRDLKPENLMLDQNMQLKITDFGLSTLKHSDGVSLTSSEAAVAAAETVARSMQKHGTGVGGARENGHGAAAGSAASSTPSHQQQRHSQQNSAMHPFAKQNSASSGLLHTQCGTPNYVAPEIITLDDRGYSGEKVDAWACGIILHVLVAGALPFDADELTVLFRLILRCNINYPPYFSAPLRDLLSHLLVANPAERYSLEQVMEHPWMTMSDDELALVSNSSVADIPPTPKTSFASAPTPTAPSPPESGVPGVNGGAAVSRASAPGSATPSSGSSAPSPLPTPGPQTPANRRARGLVAPHFAAAPTPPPEPEPDPYFSYVEASHASVAEAPPDPGGIARETMSCDSLDFGTRARSIGDVSSDPIVAAAAAAAAAGGTSTDNGTDVADTLSSAVEGEGVAVGNPAVSRPSTVVTPPVAVSSDVLLPQSAADVQVGTGTVDNAPSTVRLVAPVAISGNDGGPVVPSGDGQQHSEQRCVPDQNLHEVERRHEPPQQHTGATEVQPSASAPLTIVSGATAPATGVEVRLQEEGPGLRASASTIDRLLDEPDRGARANMTPEEAEPRIDSRGGAAEDNSVPVGVQSVVGKGSGAYSGGGSGTHQALVRGRADERTEDESRRRAVASSCDGGVGGRPASAESLGASGSRASSGLPVSIPWSVASSAPSASGAASSSSRHQRANLTGDLSGSEPRLASNRLHLDLPGPPAAFAHASGVGVAPVWRLAHDSSQSLEYQRLLLQHQQQIVELQLQQQEQQRMFRHRQQQQAHLLYEQQLGDSARRRYQRHLEARLGGEPWSGDAPAAPPPLRAKSRSLDAATMTGGGRSSLPVHGQQRRATPTSPLADEPLTTNSLALRNGHGAPRLPSAASERADLGIASRHPVRGAQVTGDTAAAPNTWMAPSQELAAAVDSSEFGVGGNVPNEAWRCNMREAERSAVGMKGPKPALEEREGGDLPSGPGVVVEPVRDAQTGTSRAPVASSGSGQSGGRQHVQFKQPADRDSRSHNVSTPTEGMVAQNRASQVRHAQQDYRPEQAQQYAQVRLATSGVVGSIGERSSGQSPSSVTGTMSSDDDDGTGKKQSVRMARLAATEAVYAAQAAAQANAAAENAAEKAMRAARAAAAALGTNSSAVGIDSTSRGPAGDVVMFRTRTRYNPELIGTTSTSPRTPAQGLAPRRLSRSGESFRNSPRPVIVDGNVMGGTTPQARLSDDSSPPPALPPSVMSTNPAVYGGGIPIAGGGQVAFAGSPPEPAVMSSQGSPLGSASPSVLQSGVSETAYVHADSGYVGPAAKSPSVGHHSPAVAEERNSQEVKPTTAQWEVTTSAGDVTNDYSNLREGKVDTGESVTGKATGADELPEVQSFDAGPGASGGHGESRLVACETQDGGDAANCEEAVEPRGSGFSPQGVNYGADFGQSVIGPDGAGGEVMEAENPFNINIPGPRSGPMNPPLQPKFIVALRNSTVGKLRFGHGKVRSASSASTGGDSSGANTSAVPGRRFGGRSGRSGVSGSAVRERGGAGALSSKRYTQFHSVHSTKKCFDLMFRVLRAYGCTKIQDTSPEESSSSRSPTYKIRFVKVQDGQPTVASIEMREVDVELTALIFKKRSTVDTKRFIAIYDEVYKRFTNAAGGDDVLSSVDD